MTSLGADIVDETHCYRNHDQTNARSRQFFAILFSIAWSPHEVRSQCEHRFIVARGGMCHIFVTHPSRWAGPRSSSPTIRAMFEFHFPIWVVIAPEVELEQGLKRIPEVWLYTSSLQAKELMISPLSSERMRMFTTKAALAAALTSPEWELATVRVNPSARGAGGTLLTPNECLSALEQSVQD